MGIPFMCLCNLLVNRSVKKHVCKLSSALGIKGSHCNMPHNLMHSARISSMLDQRKKLHLAFGNNGAKQVITMWFTLNQSCHLWMWRTGHVMSPARSAADVHFRCTVFALHVAAYLQLQLQLMSPQSYSSTCDSMSLTHCHWGHGSFISVIIVI